MIYTVKIFKPTGKFYAEDEPILEKNYCLYTKIPEIIKTKYKNKLKEGYLILVEDETGAAHIFKEN